ncbi:MAG: response regulator transcription factor [Mariprofundaceae bacterium]|nr:response regulator transcription factor [Mariprofundaceae bacterium]
MKQHIFIVDDDKEALAEMSECIEDEGFRISTASSAEIMWRKLKRDPCHLLLLDIKLPGESGLSITKKIRQNSKVGIIFISGKGDPIDRVVGLEIGADDYIAKPFTPQEVLIRVKRVLSRTAMHIYPPAQEKSDTASCTLAFDGWQLHVGAYSLIAPSGQEVSLTTAEFKLLKIFTLSPKRILSRDYLLEQIHDATWVGYDRGIDGLVSRLRKKLLYEAGEPMKIKTIRGLGYMFTAPVKSIT